jgi:hypothetical protein
VADAEGVKGTLAALRKPRKTALLAHSSHTGPPAREYLVGICLVTDVPNEAVLRSIENVVEGDCELHHPQPGSQVTAGPGDAVEEEAAQLVRQLGKPFFGKPAQVYRELYGAKQRIAAGAGALIAGCAMGHAVNRFGSMWTL